MTKVRISHCLFVVFIALPPPPPSALAQTPEPVVFSAADGVRVYADLYRGPLGFRGPLVILYHQAGSNAAEYETIAPRLVQLGATALAVDQRSGGRLFGLGNRTAAGHGKRADFNEAFADLEAALDWSIQRGAGARLVVWGSSYSAASVFRLAAARPEIDVVLAFSPGEFLGSEHSVAGYARQVRVPTFVTAGEGSELIEARAIFDAVASTDKMFHHPRVGVHGSSTLRPDRNPAGASENWRAVEEFLLKYVGGLRQPEPGDQASR
ncbi:MAG: dienelactone hydrolase [Hyphomicrobiaceae bacterium]|jgi:dienelactone hydrolase